jgi:hypothetical protein
VKLLATTAVIAALAIPLSVGGTAVSAEPTGAGPVDALVQGSTPRARTTTYDALLPSRADLMDTIRHMVSIAPRRTGTSGGRAAADYVADRLRRAGMDKVYFERSTSYSWRASDSSLTIGGQRIRQTPVGFSLIGGPTTTGTRSLGDKGLRREVVDIGSNPVSAYDVRGKIVMIDLKFLTPLAALTPLMEFVNDPHNEVLDAQTLLTANPYITTLPTTIDLLQQAGAAGMIGVLSDYFDSDKYRNEYYRRSPMKIPGMWVTKKEAARIRTLLPEHPRATMRLTTHRREVVARQPIGIIEGRSKDTVMIQSHHDSRGPGAVEDGSGTAEVLGLADYYGRVVRKTGRRPAKTLMFTTFDTHFTGYQAHMHFVKKYLTDKRTPYRIVANDTIEHIAKKGRVGPDGKLQLLDESEPRGFFENLSAGGKAMLAQSILDNQLDATAMLNGAVLQPVGLPTDASFTSLAGVPTVSLIAGPIYLYDDADTLAAVDRPSLVPVLRTNRDIVDWMAATPSDQIGLPTVPMGG